MSGALLRAMNECRQVCERLDDIPHCRPMLRNLYRITDLLITERCLLVEREPPKVYYTMDTTSSINKGPQ